MKIHYTDALDGTRRTVDRPLSELIGEALITPFFIIAVRFALRGWGH
jgi:hypothetical protein